MSPSCFVWMEMQRCLFYFIFFNSILEINKWSFVKDGTCGLARLCSPIHLCSQKGVRVVLVGSKLHRHNTILNIVGYQNCLFNNSIDKTHLDLGAAIGHCVLYITGSL